MAISPQQLTIYLYSAHRAVIFAIAQLSCLLQYNIPVVASVYGMCRGLCGWTVCRAKVTIGSLQEVVYEKSIGTKMNDLDLCLEVVSRSRS